MAKRSKKNYKRVQSPLKWHGGKYYLAKPIVQLMPPRSVNPSAPKKDDKGWVHYVEPFFGGGQVLFANDPEGISEVVNDIDGQLANFWNVLRSDSTRDKFIGLANLTPVDSDLFKHAKQVLETKEDLSAESLDVECALLFFIKYRQSRQALGESFSTFSSNRSRSGMNEQVSSWLGVVEGLNEAADRLRRVAIVSDDAITVIKREDGPRTLFYLDPPYLQSTRVSKEAYKHEMTLEQHEELLKTAESLEGRFMLSGYRSELYDDYALKNKWRLVEINAVLNSSSKREKETRVECVWMNYEGSK